MKPYCKRKKLLPDSLKWGVVVEEIHWRETGRSWQWRVNMNWSRCLGPEGHNRAVWWVVEGVKCQILLWFETSGRCNPDPGHLMGCVCGRWFREPPATSDALSGFVVLYFHVVGKAICLSVQKFKHFGFYFWTFSQDPRRFQIWDICYKWPRPITLRSIHPSLICASHYVHY